MKKNIIIIMAVSLLFFCCGCGSSRIYSKDLDEYAMWNDYTIDMLEKNFNNTLPDIDIVRRYGKEYDYLYNQAFLGNPNFHICVTLSFEDEYEFENNITNLNNLYSSVVKEQLSYYIVKGSLDDINEYCDDEIYDGMDFFFEIIIVDMLNHSIKYLSAYQWDYNRDDMVYNTLLPLTE